MQYVNAIQFALNNQIALSMEIGASSAVQICLIMMPILVGFSAFVRALPHHTRSIRHTRHTTRTNTRTQHCVLYNR
jgi:Ca2+/H+ antiporter